MIGKGSYEVDEEEDGEKTGMQTTGGEREIRHKKSQAETRHLIRGTERTRDTL